jgi:hypothetical protein
MKQTYWDCSTVGDDVTRKAYVKDGRQRIKVTRTITRDCATGLTDLKEQEGDGSDDGVVVVTLEVLRALIREELHRRIAARPESMSQSS